MRSLLPEGYSIFSWNSGHYYCSGVIKDSQGRFIHVSIKDVRSNPREWITNILIRTMTYEMDYKGGANNFTNLASFTEDIQKLYR